MTTSPSVAAIERHHLTLNLGAFVRASPNAATKQPCLIDITGPNARVFSYADVDCEIEKLVGGLRALGVDKGHKAALCLGNSAEFFLAFLALMRLGAIPVLVNPQIGETALRFVLKDAEVGAVLGSLDAAPGLKAAVELLDNCIRIAVEDGKGWHWLSRISEAAARDPIVTPMLFDDQAFQPYTAGSTGMPKGIFLTHGGMLWGIEHSELYWPVPSSERGIVAAPMFHKNALRGTIKPLLRGGGSVVIMRRFEPRAYLRALAEHGVTTCGGVPAMFAELLKHSDLLRELDFTRLKTISMGSSVVPPALVERMHAAFPNAVIKETYGLTEGGGPLRSPVDKRPVPVGSVGVPAPEIDVKLVDEAGVVSPRRGELWIRSPYILKNYVNLPDLTRERLRDGWLRTGDVFEVDQEGFYFFLSRTDDMFVCGGENIYPKEVENLIMRHPAVADVVVLPLAHETKGFAPVALVTCKEKRQVSPSDIQDFCAANGPAYAIPRAVLLCDEIPLTPAGKPDRAAACSLLTASFGTLLAAGNRAQAR